MSTQTPTADASTEVETTEFVPAPVQAFKDKLGDHWRTIDERVTNCSVEGHAGEDDATAILPRQADTFMDQSITEKTPVDSLTESTDGDTPTYTISRDKFCDWKVQRKYLDAFAAIAGTDVQELEMYTVDGPGAAPVIVHYDAWQLLAMPRVVPTKFLGINLNTKSVITGYSDTSAYPGEMTGINTDTTLEINGKVGEMHKQMFGWTFLRFAPSEFNEFDEFVKKVEDGQELIEVCKHVVKKYGTGDQKEKLAKILDK